MPITRRAQLADEYVKEICGRIDAIKASIDSGELSGDALEAAKVTLADLNKHLDDRIEEIKKEHQEYQPPKKFLGFI